MSIILAIDYGQKNIGLAITDEYAKMALPYDTIQNNGADLVIKKLQEIIKEESVGEILVGVPTSLHGEHTDSIELKGFLKNLKNKIGLPVILIDERMSSKMADHFKTDKNFKKSGARDKVAASIILQSYLEKINS
jgi:putative Holliday junction resolvase